MDSHHEMVMDRIRMAEPGKIRYYFGWSSVLDREAFDVWKQEHGYSSFVLPDGELARIEGMDLDFDFASRWWGGRVAGLKEAEGAVVHGILLAIASEDWPIIQHKEGVITGVSVEIPVRARRGDGSAVDATAFTTNPARVSREGAISARYLAAWEKGARACGLPEEYILRIAGTK